MAEAVVFLALRTLKDLLLEEAKFLSGVSTEVKGLESQLKEMQCLLKDADRRQYESNSLHNWIAEIRDLAYRAEDAVETYAVEVSSRKGKGVRKLFKRFSCVLNEGLTLHRIGSEISSIRFEIERVHKSMEAYGIREIIRGESSVSASIENQQWKRQTYPLETEDCFVGMKDDLIRLVSLTIDQDKQYRVISICGMGGKGKTTITRKVYNHFEIKQSFESLAWVCITQQCQIRSVLEDVLKQLLTSKQKKDIMYMSDTELIQKLCQVQKAKRCLIVLDDLWQIDHWNALKQAFLVVGLNNKILLTTRKQNVAAVGFPYELGLLEADDGWKLLEKKAFLQSNFTEFAGKEKFKKIGIEMVHKCGCLPLCISLLGGILNNKKSSEEWEAVNKNIKSYLYKSEDMDQDLYKEIGGVVDLSYEDLPSYLKPCFLYMGLYKEDEVIWVKDLYRLWIAQGMISHENQGNEESLMDVAEFYLSKLVSRCVVQIEEVGDVNLGKRYSSCKLHDVVRELCLSKGKDVDFRLSVMDYQAGKLVRKLNPSFFSTKTRHLAIYFTGQEDIKLKESIKQEIDSHIRSLQFVGRGFNRKRIEFPRNFFDFWKLKLLRVLIFEYCTFEGGKLPTEIGNLVCLRHLSLHRCILDELPFSISNLTYLYTLDLYGTMNVRIPNVLNKMLGLKHLYFPRYNNDKIGNYRLRLDGLDELETLSGFNSLVHDLKSISNMKNLRQLRASVHDNKTLVEIITGINTNWKKLHLPLLEIEEGCELTLTEQGRLVLSKVLTCSNLCDLWIKVPIRKLGIYGQCGTQIIFPRLINLLLSNCEIEDDPMETLEKLPFLEYLHLLERSYVGEVMICHSMGFPKLKVLQLKGLSNLREWSLEKGAMSSLDKLKIHSCQNLKMIPDGLKFVVTMKNLKIIKTPELGKRVGAMLDDGGEGEDYHKVRHVPSVVVYYK